MAKQQTPKKKPTKRDPDETENQDENEETEDEGEDEDNSAEENRRINAIVTSRVKREMKPVLQQLATISESLTKLSTPKKEETEDEDDEDGQDGEEKPKESKVDPKITKKLSRMEKELADEKAARKKAEMERQEELERGKKKEMHSAFDSALAELGVTDPVLRKAAVRELEESGKMIRDDSGKIKFRGLDKYQMETDYDPKIGLKGWIEKEGKSFMPAIDAGGSGTGGTQRGLGNTNLTSKEISKLSDTQKAAINLERACSGMPPLE